MTRPLGGFLEFRTEPPFRDPESLLFIQEVDDGHLVNGDWYSYVSSFGKTCMSSLCGDTQYALALIYDSRKGAYTSFVPYGKDIWQRLQGLDMDILVAYDPAYYSSHGFYIMPFELEGCIVESVSVDGKVYENAVYDAKGPNYIDKAGVFHFNGLLDDYEWDWTQHMEEIFEDFVWEANLHKRDILADTQHAPLVIPEEYWEKEPDRKILCYADTYAFESPCRYSQLLMIKKYPDSTYIVQEDYRVSTVFYEAPQNVIGFWSNECTAVFYVVIDNFCFHSLKSFKDRVWYFEDDGKTLRAYSGIRGLRRLLEFADNSWKDGRMTAKK